MTANPKHRRFRSRVHLAHVAAQSCCVKGCRTWPVEVHHLLMGPEPKGRGIKASDYWTVPLCHAHHRGQDSPHHHGNEDQWSESHHVHLMSVAWQMVWYSPARIQIIEHERESQSANRLISTIAQYPVDRLATPPYVLDIETHEGTNRWPSSKPTNSPEN